MILLVTRSEKEKSKFQAEVYELLAQVENVTKEKITFCKTVERLEINISELHIKIEELNRTIVDITSHKQRLSQENVELVKEVQDLKVYKIYNGFYACKYSIVNSSDLGLLIFKIFIISVLSVCFS